MTKDNRQTITCNLCAETKLAHEFQIKDGRRNNRCRTCFQELRRAHYRANPRARASQLAASTGTYVRRKFPAADTGLKPADYAELLLTATHCKYCGQANDGTFTFSLDHRIALANGGRHELANLAPCCEPCNRAKSNMPEDVFVAWLDGVAIRRVQILTKAAD